MAASTITRGTFVDGTTPWNSSNISSLIYDRIDQLFSGVGGYATLELGGALKINGALTQLSNDGGALGTSSLGWSDLFLASGAVINFNNGDVTLTHSTNTLTFAGATSGYNFSDGPLKTPTTVSVGNATPASTGAGITFPAAQSASSDANTLDDYEEGPWTPTDGSGAGLTFTSASGSYTKIGRLVHVFGFVQYPSTANGNNATIASLPFTVANTDDARSGGVVGVSTETTCQCFVLNKNATTGNFFTNAAVNVTNATLSGDQVYFSATYYV